MTHRMNYLLALVVLLLLLVAPGVVARADEVDDYLKTQIEKNHIPGLAVVIVREGKIIKLAAYGMANLEWDQPVTLETVFQLASSGKLFAGIALMMLVEEGKLKLGDKIARHLPEAPPMWQDITIRHLATHSSGIRDDIETKKEMSAKEFVQAAAALPLSHKPGERSGYGLAGYIVLTRVMENASGQNFAEVIRTRLVRPLALTATQFDFSTDQDNIRSSNVVRKRAAIYNWEQGSFRNFEFLFPERAYSGGGLLSSTRDISKLFVALHNQLLSEKSLEQMWNQDRLGNGMLNNFGIGCVIKTHNGRKTVGHSGGPALSDILHFPEEKLTIAVLTNAQRLYPYLAQGVADLFVPPPPVKIVKAIEDKDPRASQTLKRLLLEAAQDKVDGSLFSAEAQKTFVPAFKSFGLPFFKSLDSLQSFQLVQHKEDEQGVSRRYQAVYGNRAIFWNFHLNKEGKITALEPSME
jgi:CubicO group peptidase (beta-lactamase class C family)